MAHSFRARRLLASAALLMAATGVGFVVVHQFWPLARGRQAGQRGGLAPECPSPTRAASSAASTLLRTWSFVRIFVM
jgi:hypothetical protein